MYHFIEFDIGLKYNIPKTKFMYSMYLIIFSTQANLFKLFINALCVQMEIVSINKTVCENRHYHVLYLLYYFYCSAQSTVLLLMFIT